MNFLERGRRYQRDEELSKELLFSLAYKGTPYEHPEEGYVESVRSITVEDVRSFYARHYRQDTVTIGLAGGYPADFPARVRTDLGALGGDGERPPRPPAPQPETPEGIQVLIVEKDTDATAISFGFPITALPRFSRLSSTQGF